MQVHELMTKDLKLIESTASLLEAAEVMRDRNVGVLPVTDGARAVGILTDRDIVVRALADYRDPAQTTVREVLTPRVSTIYFDQEVSEAAELMAKDQVRRLLVVDHQQAPVGILSLGDVATNGQALSSGAEALRGVSQPEHEHAWQQSTKP